jgi:regulator of sirC expression with transglutaminase-like and TPR domain
MSPPGAALVSLLARDPHAPVEHAATLIARDFDPSVDFSNITRTLDTLAEVLALRLRTRSDTHARAMTFASWFADEAGFRGNEEHYYDPRNSYLHEVLSRRRGIPISLAVVAMAAARRVELRVDGVGMPGHFLVRVGGDEGVLLDLFFGAREVTSGVLRELATCTMGGAERLRAEHLRAVSTREMAIRMLQNLKGLFEAGSDHARAMLACDRLYDLTGSIDHRRDRGFAALALGLLDGAAEDLGAYLAARPQAPDGARVRSSLERARTRRTARALQ